MKPNVICHMGASIDGRILPSRWRPAVETGGVYERLHTALQGDGWLVGRVTGQEFAKAAAYPERTDQVFPRESWFARRQASQWVVVLDAHGKIAWGRSDVGGDPIVVVLTEQVADAHLAGLRADGLSYIFAGATELDLALALEILNRELGLKQLLLEGGGIVNGEFLRAGLVDEISLIVLPALDGSSGAPSVFDSAGASGPAPLRAVRLESSQALEGDAVWLRYRLEYS